MVGRTKTAVSVTMDAVGDLLCYLFSIHSPDRLHHINPIGLITVSYMKGECCPFTEFVQYQHRRNRDIIVEARLLTNQRQPLVTLYVLLRDLKAVSTNSLCIFCPEPGL